MPLSKRSKPYIIPEYSLTGDLLSFLTCGLQYRYYNKGSLPPSTPVQLWFGEFIHGVMEEAFIEWRDNNQRKFPWDWATLVRDIEARIDRRLRAGGLYPPPQLFCPYPSSTSGQGLCPDSRHPHKLIASKRAEASMNTWGPHLFPLIDEAEVSLQGIRNMPNHIPGISRSNYFGVTGIADVISSVNLEKAPQGNLILHKLHSNSSVKRIIGKLPSSEYEVIVDYKGMRRPSLTDDAWEYHEWQILTYAWLRSQQPQSRPIVAGVLLYLNELALSSIDTKRLKEDIKAGSTDILPEGADLKRIMKWKRGNPPQVSRVLTEERSFRVIPVDWKRIKNALRQFDRAVSDIENAVLSEMSGKRITSCWQSNPKRDTCTACDFKTFCPKPAPRPYHPTVP